MWRAGAARGGGVGGGGGRGTAADGSGQGAEVGGPVGGVEVAEGGRVLRGSLRCEASGASPGAAQPWISS